MTTTMLYVEVVSIGVESLIWIVLLFENLLYNKLLATIIEAVKTLGSSLLLIVMVYVLGCIVDRIADRLFRTIDRQIKSTSGFSGSCLLLEKSQTQIEFFTYTRMRLRILRASAMNLPIICGMTVWYLLQNNYSTSIVITSATLIMSLAVFSFIGAIDSMKSYYDKAYKLNQLQTK